MTAKSLTIRPTMCRLTLGMYVLSGFTTVFIATQDLTVAFLNRGQWRAEVL